MNNAVFIGRLGKDAELKTLDGGKQVINFSLAVDDGYGDKKSTLWIDCAKFGEKTGVVQYLKKGTQVAAQGNVGIRKWEGEKGHGATLTLRVVDLRLLGGKSEQSSYSEPSQTPADAPVVEKDDLPF